MKKGWHLTNSFLFRKPSDRERKERRSVYDYNSHILKSIGLQGKCAGQYKSLPNFQQQYKQM